MEDMIGNLYEWVDLWGQAGRDMNITQGQVQEPWPKSYVSATSGEDCGGRACDRTWNINGEAHSNVTGSWIAGLPFAVLRSGPWNYGTVAGAFAFNANNGPSTWGSGIGLRCAKGGM